MEKNDVENFSTERRFARRYETKDILVYIRYLKKINWFHRFYGPFLLDDIAISSIRFVCHKNFLANSLVEIKLVSDNLTMELNVKGRVIGKKADLFEKKYEYVVQFNPYGKGLKYNSFQNKEKLEKFFRSIELEEKNL
jgi:hypothetical protein